MKLRRVKLVGCGHRSNGYFNHEGYSDPTAGCALAGSTDIYAAPLVRRAGEREKIVYEQVPPVSEMDAFLTARNRKKHRKRKW